MGNVVKFKPKPDLNRAQRRAAAKQKPKLPPKKTEEQQRAEHHENLMNCIVGETLARHAGLSSEEYLKRLGFDKFGRGEEEAVRIATFNIMLALAKEYVLISDKVAALEAQVREWLIGEGHAVEEGENKDGK